MLLSPRHLSGLVLCLSLAAPVGSAAQTPPPPGPAAEAPPPPGNADDPSLRLAERVGRAVKRGDLTRDQGDAFQRYVARRMLADTITVQQIDELFRAELAEPGAHEKLPDPTQTPPPAEAAPVDAAPPPEASTGVPVWALGAGAIGLLAIAGLVGWRVRGSAGSPS